MRSLEYFLLDGMQNQNPVTYRGVKAPGDLATDYPHRIGIFWPYPSDTRGLADAAVNAAQNQFEDALDPLEEQDFGILALVVFGDGRKEWHWYVRSIEEWMDLFNARLAEYPRYPISIEHAANDHWGYHAAFVKWAKVS